MWEYLILIVGILVCAFQAIRTKRLLVAALWLAGTSALVAMMMYLLGAYQIAVIELSVGAGLVTVLFVFAINIAGEEPIPSLSLIPKPLAWLFVLGAIGLLGWQLLPMFNFQGFEVSLGLDFQSTVWVGRKIDLYLQVALIFAGVISMMGLLSEEANKSSHQEKDTQ
ncbi:MAG: hypothetical protein CVU39_15670 [Chloroflexi bacterium HGW-Chloroflexi-10]|nr:MAG: hypothetical protein CVU39_15670 [Chloroflexi bacterium HGW-Chloroflexi-10]